MLNKRELRAISVRQPWAYAIMHRGKDIENKPMRTDYRGPILIHASLTVESREARKLKLDPDGLPTGVIIGVVEIFDCVRNGRLYSKWAIPGWWHWRLRNPRVLARPIPFKGKLGFMRVPARLLKGARFRAP